MCFAVGNSAPIVGRPIPLIRPRMSVDADNTAPVFPALANASAFPSRWSARPTAMEEFFFVFRAELGASCISMISSAWTTRNVPAMFASAPPGAYFRSSDSMACCLPTRMTETRPEDSAMASTAPWTTTPGA